MDRYAVEHNFEVCFGAQYLEGYAGTQYLVWQAATEHLERHLGVERFQMQHA